jgi:phage-related protein
MSFTGITDYLNIDCDTMDVYRQAAENKNNLMTGSFPVLPSGNSTVTFTGGISTVTITPRWYVI